MTNEQEVQDDLLATMKKGQGVMANWHVDKTVPLALIFTICIQGAIGIWWASDITSRIIRVEAAETAHATAVDAMIKIHTERIIRLEEKSNYTVEALGRIEKKLDSKH